MNRFVSASFYNRCVVRRHPEIARAVRRDIGYLALDMNRGRIHSCQETINRHPAIHLYVRTL